MDYILDFHNDLTHWLEEEISKNKTRLLWNGRDISRAVFNFLWYTNLEMRDNYICARKNNQDDDYFKNQPIIIPSSPTNHTNLINHDLDTHPWKNILSREAGQILVYADSERRLNYLLPIIISTNTPVIVLTRTYNIPEIVLNKPNIKILPLSLLKTSAVTASGLFKINPLLASYTHTIYCYIHWLRPKKIICCDGCQTQYQLAAIFSKSLSIDCDCYQFGWPGYIHAGFRKLPYSSFITWGKWYSDVMATYNPNVKFLSKERLGPCSTKGSHNCISFFLQAPVFVSSRSYLSDFYDAIFHISKVYPDKTIIVRPHPEYGMESNIYNQFKKYQNIDIDSSDNIENTYSRTAVAISQYSSCLVESELFGCKAICFNQTQGFVYEALPSHQRAYNISDLLRLIAEYI